MRQGRGFLVFFLFAFLSLIIILQIYSMVQSDRFYVLINRLDDVLQSGPRIVRQTPIDDDQADQGDWLIWGLTDEPGTLNPVTRRDIYAEWIIYQNIMEGLLEYDYDTLELKKLLAKGYDISEDGLEIVFRLKEDIHFHDGIDITADDVIFTYETIMDPNVDGAHLTNYYREIERVEKIDQKTVRFFMKRPYFKALEIASMLGVGIMPQHIYQYTDSMAFNKNRHPYGSGPYVFEKWEVGKEVVLVRNENYWGKKPKLDRIIFKFFNNEVAAVQAFRAGDLDFLEPLPEQFADLVNNKKFNENFKCLSYYAPTIPYFYVGWNNDVGVFKDKRVRLAMTHLIDRERVIRFLLKGQGKITTGPFYIYGKQYNSAIEPWPYDPVRAAELLDEAGWIDRDGDGLRDKDGRPFRFKLMIRSGDPFYERLAKFIKDEAANVGIEVIVDTFEWSIFIERLLDRDFEAEIAGWGGVVEEDPYQVWHSSQGVKRGSNHVGFANEQADTLIVEARKTLDRDKRNVLYHQLHRLIHEQQPYTFIYARPEMRLLDKRFENVIVHKLGLNWRQWYVPKNKQKYK